ncbi:hypothetical protein K457DRAFT_137300 [Linnemannia elongata AG-77]|uniref:Uncharacterized protein n=1 Tax=Linnemannia elongata AG-77 TaxID=1314771 RepID=A0A197K0J2_9FUNG|nr:hypothetical protein K457DRAFT_137300 [Linnemannia elongata AG-77]
MPKKTGKPPACTDFYHCVLDATDNRQMEKHTQEYHKPEPISATNNNPALPPVQLFRDPNQGMYFVCLHPDCDHTSITRDNARRHYKSCRLVLDGSEPITTITAVTTQQRRSTLSKQQQRHRKSLVLSHRRYLVSRHTRRHPPSSRSIAPRHSSAESDSDDASPSLRNITPALDDPITAQLLGTMSKLTNAVAGLSEQLAKRASKVHELSEHTDWLKEEVDYIRNHRASLEMHTGSLQKEMRRVVRYMEDLVEDNRDVRGRLKGVRPDLGRVGFSGRGYR